MCMPLQWLERGQLTLDNDLLLRTADKVGSDKARKSELLYHKQVGALETLLFGKGRFLSCEVRGCATFPQMTNAVDKECCTRRPKACEHASASREAAYTQERGSSLVMSVCFVHMKECLTAGDALDRTARQ